MRSIAKRLSALCLCAFLTAAPAADGLAALAADAGTVHIASAREFKAFAAKCVSNTYSQGLRVVLDKDIDLSGFGSISAPVFCGEFDGQHHTISGYSCAGKGSDRGLFRYVKPGAEIHNLTVSGRVAPEGTKSGLGMIAGRNEGLIRACAVAGEVTGDESVGGIVGVNEASGVIRDCVSEAAVTGSTNAGGIAGRSEGTIEGCVNRGDVNIDSEQSATNTGGITGRSEGVISGCTNEGTIGYQHIGYNTGGVVGIQNGSVVHCINTGKVYGRKDVGGIVGQFEPYIDLEYGESPIDTLDSALDTLSGLLQQLADQVSGTVGDAVADFKTMNEALSSIRDTAHAAGTEAHADTQLMLDDVHDSAQAVSRALDTLIDDTDDFAGQTNKTLDSISKQMKKVRKNLAEVPNTIGGTVTSATDAVDDTMRDIDKQISKIESELSGAQDDLRRMLQFVKDVSGLLQNPDPDALQQALDALGTVDPRARLNRALRALSDIKDSLGLLTDNLKWGISQSRDKVQASLSDANDALIKLEKLANTLNSDAKAYSDSALSSLRTINSKVSAIENTVHSYAGTTMDKGQQRMDEVNDQLHIVSDTVGQMTDGASRTNTDLHGTTSAIISQLNVVEDAIYDMTKTPEKTVDDISDSAGESGPGRVYSCRNEGAVEADTNVGGIAGTVAPELGFDPEEDLDLDADNVLVDTTAFVKATLRDCRNNGDVTARNDCAGGILGRAESGAVLGCVSRARIESTSGGKCGGIAGLSEGVIKQCASLTDLTGGDNLGGIAGEGTDIIDCRAMTRIDSDGEKLGAIAGAADGQITGNYFLDEEWAGVDGINYAGQSEPAAFDVFSKLSGVPADFLTFEIRFVTADGAAVAVLPVSYGGALDPEQIPAVPSVAEEHGEWETFEADAVTRSQTVHAVYSNLRSTIASAGSHPTLLAEGTFSPEARVDVSDWTPDADQIPSGYVLVESHSYKITDDGPVPETVNLRAHAGEKGSAVAVLKDGGLTLTDSTLDGSYLVFEGDANGAYAILRRDLTGLYIVLGLAGILLILVLIRIRLRRMRARRKQTQPPEHAPEHASEPEHAPEHAQTK